MDDSTKSMNNTTPEEKPTADAPVTPPDASATQPTMPNMPTTPPIPEEQPMPASPPTPAAPETPSPASSNQPATPPAGQSLTPSDPPTHSPMEKHVPLKTVLLIVGLAILAAVLLFIALKPAQKSPLTTTKTPTPTTKPSIAHSILAMTLDTTSSASASDALAKSVDVTIDTGINKVEGVQFEISYDPTVLTNVKVTPGTFFTNPLILLNTVDSKNGKINYALGIQPNGTALTGSGTVAIITYDMVPTTVTSTTKLSFLPKTQVVQVGTLGSVLEKAEDLLIPVTGLTTSPSASQAAGQ